MSQSQTVYRKHVAQTEETLASLLYYWQRGLLSCDEMLSRWHACHVTEEELVRQVREVLFHPIDRKWFAVAQRCRSN